MKRNTFITFTVASYLLGIYVGSTLGTRIDGPTDFVSETRDPSRPNTSEKFVRSSTLPKTAVPQRFEGWLALFDGGPLHRPRILLEEFLATQTVPELEGLISEALGSTTSVNADYIAEASIAELATRNPTAAVEQISTLKPGSILQKSAIIAAVGRMSPEQLAEAIKSTKSSVRRSILQSIPFNWLGKNPKDGMDGLKTFLSDVVTEDELKQISKSISAGVLQSWANKRPQELLAWGEKNANTKLGQTAIGNAVSTVFGWNNQFAASLVARLCNEGKLDPTWVDRVGASWLRDDPDQAIKWARMQNEDVAPALLTRFAESIVSENPSSLRNVSTTLPEEARTEFIASNISKWARKDLQEALDYIALQPEVTQETLHKAVLAEWSSKDPQEAANFLSGVTGASPEQYSIVAAQYAESNPDVAFDWARNLASETGKTTAMHSIIAHLSQEDPNRCIPLLNTLDESNQREALAAVVAESWAKSDLSSAMSWIASLQPDETRTLGAAALSQASFNPVAASEAANNWLRRFADDPTSQADSTKIVVSVSSALAQINPQDAIGWIDSLPTQNKVVGISSVVNEWSRIDPVGASEWLATLPNALISDAALSSLVENIADDPERAFQWATKIGNPDLRVTTLSPIIKHWFNIDPVSATRAIHGSSVGSAKSHQSSQ